MTTDNFDVLETPGGVPIKAWWRSVAVEEKAMLQLRNCARLPFVGPHIAAMPDTHWGIGATVGSVIPTEGAICPATVGVDIGCGMMAVRISDLDWFEEFKMNVRAIREAIEKAVPHGRTENGGPGDRGAWHDIPEHVQKAWFNDIQCTGAFELFEEQHPGALSKNAKAHLGTLGTGNHFIEVSLDQKNRPWVVLHSGSRGFGNKIGSYFIALAKQKCEEWFIRLPDPDLAYLPASDLLFHQYVALLNLAQHYAWRNRELMMGAILGALGAADKERIHCHHNYMARERHFGRELFITRKGAVRAQVGDLVIIPGSMGARTYIAKGLGNRMSFCSCSHGAGRTMGRREAERRFTVADHEAATAGVECHKGVEVIDETPAAYKNIESVMAAQTDLVEPVEILKQIVCVKGFGK